MPRVTSWFSWVLLALGGATGTVARYATARMADRIAGSEFPYGTLTVNLIGCFLFGLFAALLERGLVLGETMRLIVLTGVLGGFTTFSAYSGDVVRLLQSGRPAMALTNLVVTNVLGVALCIAGWFLARQGSG